MRKRRKVILELVFLFLVLLNMCVRKLNGKFQGLQSSWYISKVLYSRQVGGKLLCRWFPHFLQLSVKRVMKLCRYVMKDLTENSG